MARRLRAAAFVALIAWAAVDQLRFFLGTSDSDLTALARAEALNPYDSSVQRRTARLLIQQHRWAEAYATYGRLLGTHADDGEALVNLGTLAMQLGRPAEAMQRWESALDIESSAPLARQMLARHWAARADEADKAGRASDAAYAFKQALALDEQGADPSTLGADWFNYGQFLRRSGAEPRVVIACLIRAEALLRVRSDARLETVRAVRETLEREQPAASAAARRSLESALAAVRRP